MAQAFWFPFPAQVSLINWNDTLLGALVCGALIQVWRQQGTDARSILAGSWRQGPTSIPLVLTLLFRDATLWRETVEYMWDHYRLDYPHTTTDPVLRPHGIAGPGRWIAAIQSYARPGHLEQVVIPQEYPCGVTKTECH